MYQRIMVPVDQSDAARAAFAEATQLARLCGARLRLVHVVNIAHTALAPVGLPGLDSNSYADALAAAEAKGGGLLQDLQAEALAAGLVCEHELLEEKGLHTAATILAAAERWPADLIVMGTHGFSGLAHLVFGSVAENLLHHTRVPVLLVRRQDDEDDED
ncbi:universal stress protein [Chitinilyticum litopenaei]|uniref:universal stress protein n=1 Tax=Chitinilyticum litopenaei TaxID=1121276 RepID=UPI00040574AC|nr:universal stress protein [Chitinilyticum litopenaei]